MAALSVAYFFSASRKTNPSRRQDRAKFPAQGAVAGHAARHGHATRPQAQRGPDGLGDENVNYSRLHAGAQIAQPRRIVGQGRVLFQEVADGRFQTGEAEIVAGIVQHRAGKGMGARVALRGQAVHLRAGGIGQTNQFAHFVETFAGGVVHGRAKHAMLEFPLDLHEQGVPAADDQGDGGLELRRSRPGAAAAEIHGE